MTKDAEEASCCASYYSKRYWRSIPKRWFPIVSWLPHYSLEDLKGDIIAGLSVGITVIPQGLALAQLAGLPTEYGLYSAFMGSFMYAIFGTCKDLVIGPTSVMALMTAEHVMAGGPIYAVMLTFLCGCVQLIFGILNLGFLVNFISASVLSGFTTAAAIIIATSQLKGLLGLRFKSQGFIENIHKTFLNIQHANLYDFGMGASAVIFLLLLKQYKDAKCSSCFKLMPRLQYFLHIMWWCCATARNLIIVLLCSVIAAVFLSSGKSVFTLTQHVDAGLPSFSLPPFSISFMDVDKNMTIHRDTLYILKDLGSGVIIIPLLSLLEAIAIAKVFTRSRKLDATREMIAVGMGNMMGSFVSSYPVTGSFSRTVINNSTGVRTPLGGLFSGLLVLVALGVLAPSFHYIPRACLNAIVFSAVIFMIHYRDIPAMWKMSKSDLIPFSVTFLLSITLGLEYGLLFGIAISLVLLLFKQNNAKIKVTFEKMGKALTHIHVTPDECVFFPSIETLKGKVCKAVYSLEGDRKVIVHADRLTSLDYATAMGISSMAASFKKENIALEFHVTKAAAFESLSCLEDCITICKPQEELQELTSDNAIAEKPYVNEESHESDSTIALLSTRVDIDEDLRPDSQERLTRHVSS